MQLQKISLKLLSLGAVLVFLPSFADAQQAGGGRASDPEPTQRRVVKQTRPTIKRSAPKKVVVRVKTAEAYQAEGDKFFEAKDHDSALTAYESAVKVKPLLKSLYRIGWIYNEFREYQKAIPVLNQAARIGPSEPLVFQEKGYAHRRLKQYDDARVALQRAISLAPNSYLSTYELGALYNDLGQYDEATRVLNQSIAAKSDYAESYEERGYAQFKLKLYPEAIASFRRSIELDPKNAGAYISLGDVYYSGTKQYKEAVEPYLMGMVYDPNNHIAARHLAFIYNETRDYTGAARWAETSIKIKADYYPAYIEAGLAYYNLKRDDEAIAAYQKAERLKPDNSFSFFGLGDVYYARKQYELALENYAKGLKLTPNAKVALYRSGWCLNHLKRYPEAAVVLAKAIDVDPNVGSYHREIGFAYWNLNQLDEALSSFNRAASLDRDDPLAHYYLGMFYAERKDRSRASGSYNELIRLKSELATQVRAAIEKIK